MIIVVAVHAVLLLDVSGAWNTWVVSGDVYELAARGL
jgi:hypothetical protein